MTEPDDRATTPAVLAAELGALIGQMKRRLRREASAGDFTQSQLAVLGRLDDFETRSGYVITPVVVWAGAARAMRPNPDEVESIHRIPIDEFMRADAPILEPTDDPARPVLKMPVAGHWIAAPTAAVLYQFREVCIKGLSTRVAHFDQPRFAWR